MRSNLGQGCSNQNYINTTLSNIFDEETDGGTVYRKFKRPFCDYSSKIYPAPNSKRSNQVNLKPQSNVKLLEYHAKTTRIYYYLQIWREILRLSAKLNPMPLLYPGIPSNMENSKRVLVCMHYQTSNH